MKTAIGFLFSLLVGAFFGERGISIFFGLDPAHNLELVERGVSPVYVGVVALLIALTGFLVAGAFVLEALRPTRLPAD